MFVARLKILVILQLAGVMERTAVHPSSHLFYIWLKIHTQHQFCFHYISFCATRQRRIGPGACTDQHNTGATSYTCVAS